MLSSTTDLIWAQLPEEIMFTILSDKSDQLYQLGHIVVSWMSDICLTEKYEDRKGEWDVTKEV